MPKLQKDCSPGAPDIGQLMDMVDDIHRDDQRAADIIQQASRLVERKDVVLQDFDLNEVIATTLAILEPEAAKREIKLSATPASEIFARAGRSSSPPAGAGESRDKRHGRNPKRRRRRSDVDFQNCEK